MPQIDQSRVLIFSSLFRSRTDVYARLWQDVATGKFGYAPVYRLNKQTEPLTDFAILQHLLGKETIGVYPLLSDNTTHFLAIDFDKHTWLQDSVQLVKLAHLKDIPCYLERSKSGNGGHVWFFFEENVLAWKARQIGKLLITEAGLNASRAFDRMFPSQDQHTGKGMGNLIALPLQGKYLQAGNSAFINSDGQTYPDQWDVIAQIKKTTQAQIDALLMQPTLPIKTQTHVVEQGGDDQELARKVKTTENPVAKLSLSSQIYIPDLCFRNSAIFSYNQPMANLTGIKSLDSYLASIGN